MALRNQPYIPLYVQDYLTDEKLNMCSLESQGVFIKIMCILHKSNEYGTILLKQKDKQNQSTCLNFAYKFAKLLPIQVDILKVAITELVDEGVLEIDGDVLMQKRMVHDNKISLIRSKVGKKGGKKTQSFLLKQKLKQNTEYESEDVIEYNNVIKNIVSEFYEFQSAQHKGQLTGWLKNRSLINDSCEVIDKLQRLDGFSYDDIMLVLRNATKDSFWSNQIISLRGLRNKGKNGQTKFQNAAVKLLKKDVWDEMLRSAETEELNAKN